MSGLSDRSRAKKSHLNATDPVVVKMLVGARRKHPTWGPRKLKAWLEGKGYEMPATSTIGSILRREGLVRPKKRRSRPGKWGGLLGSLGSTSSTEAGSARVFEERKQVHQLTDGDES